MSFNHPLGLLALIGIPVLVIVYIIKSQYAEQTIASTYLWELSEKFLKKRRKVKPFSNVLSLVLQILAVVAISLAIAQPKFIIPDSAYEYCFILDGSASMNTISDGQTRFETGKEEIANMIRSAKDGSSFSLVYAGKSTTEVFRKVTDKKSALSQLDNIECSWSAAGCADAVGIAQEYFTENNSPVVYLVTDKEYETNVNLINLSKGEENYALVSYAYGTSSSKITVTGEAVSYRNSAELSIELYVDDEKVGTTSISTEKLVPTEFSFILDKRSFSSLKVVIADEDGLMQDNVGIMYTTAEDKNNRTLVISDLPSYLEFALKSSGKTAVDVVGTAKYSEDTAKYSGYGLYIFDTFSDIEKAPSELPKGGTVWFFNLQKSIPKTGFGFRETVEAEGKEYFEPTYTSSASSFAKSLTKDLTRQPLAVKKYSRYVTNRKFTAVMTYGGDNLVFVGTNENGDREVVFAFDLHDSDFAMKPDYFILFKNLLNYSFPSVLEETLYTVGETMTVNLPKGTSDFIVTSPDSKKSHPDFATFITNVQLNETGTYGVTVILNGAEQNFSVFVRPPKEESYDVTVGQVQFVMTSNSSYSDGFYDGLLPYFILLAVAFLFDWGVYCYEQYQLR